MSAMRYLILWALLGGVVCGKDAPNIVLILADARVRKGYRRRRDLAGGRRGDRLLVGLVLRRGAAEAGRPRVVVLALHQGSRSGELAYSVPLAGRSKRAAEIRPPSPRVRADT